jgi:hypothetical protein
MTFSGFHYLLALAAVNLMNSSPTLCPGCLAIGATGLGPRPRLWGAVFWRFSAMNEVTQILSAIEGGDLPATDRLCCPWSTKNCAGWPLRGSPTRILGTRSSLPIWFTPPTSGSSAKVTGSSGTAGVTGLTPAPGSMPSSKTGTIPRILKEGWVRPCRNGIVVLH